ncbi:M1-specific T cell receptor alpha chain-like [Micropterus dolomieu]|uniref:M1-specific T cell receptor alpha chain-like n=1 Tax=Micropterus dolomieu TaxID=147949 RepID=UPI001E8E77A3|nr:M1-specific T cell receptor alpha chain-like [Micropterus dolomieu]
MIFGSGTRLNIEPKDEFEPSYYKLKDGNNTEACLATGFSRQNATKLDPKNEGLFNKSEAVLISEEPLDGLFNQVALLNSTSEGKCQETDGDGLCEETLELDPTVNGMTLTITILRLIFFKTVVFNIVMSLRLWISQ